MEARSATGTSIKAYSNDGADPTGEGEKVGEFTGVTLV